MRLGKWYLIQVALKAAQEKKDEKKEEIASLHSQLQVKYTDIPVS